MSRERRRRRGTSAYPSQVDIDVAISDEKTILVEVKSHVRQSDVYTFKRKAELYEKLKAGNPQNCYW